jgi:tetratricopeptide (TPR) repeat protein
MKGLLGGWAVLIFAGALCAQTPGTQTQSQDTPQGLPKCLSDVTDYQYSVTFTQLELREHEAVRRQFEDQLRGPAPITEKGLANEIRRAPAETVIKDVKRRGVDFDMTPGIEKKLRKSNASEELIEAVREAGPRFRAQMAKLILGPGSAGVQNVPKEQARGFSLIVGESDPDKVLTRVETFTKQYPDSPLLGYVYSLAANAYQHEGDVEKVVAFTGYSLNFNPDNLTSLILRVEMLPQPQYLRGNAAYRGRILQEALSEGNHALQLIAQIPKQPNETEVAYHKRLADYASEIHGPLGLVHLELASGGPAGLDTAELTKAEQELSTAVNTASNPTAQNYYRLGEAYALNGKWDEAIQAYTKAGKLGQGTLIKTHATEQIAQMEKSKAQGTLASNP